MAGNVIDAVAVADLLPEPAVNTLTFRCAFGQWG